jgi:hypothetical protein
MIELLDGNLLLAGETRSFGAGKSDLWLISIIADQYAKKDSLFSFKIPVPKDSLDYIYTPLTSPDDMQVTAGGTISWLPKADSTYLEYVEFLVTNKTSNHTDTLSFNIFVNDTLNSTPIYTLKNIRKKSSGSFEIRKNPILQNVTISSLDNDFSVEIFDSSGRKISTFYSSKADISKSFVTWNGKDYYSGVYYLKITSKCSTVVEKIIMVQ